VSIYPAQKRHSPHLKPLYSPPYSGGRLFLPIHKVFPRGRQVKLVQVVQYHLWKFAIYFCDLASSKKAWPSEGHHNTSGPTPKDKSGFTQRTRETSPDSQRAFSNAFAGFSRLYTKCEACSVLITDLEYSNPVGGRSSVLSMQKHLRL
jgi:hypothetical protein